MKPARRAFLASLAVACAPRPLAAGVDRPMLRGVNVAGLEFTEHTLPGVVDRDYVAPDPRELAFYAAAGASVIRIPFLWERLEPALGKPFDQAYLSLLTRAVSDAAPMRVILCAHQYGRRRIDGRAFVIGEAREAPIAAFAGFWARAADLFRDEPRVMIGLQNEPHDQSMAILVKTQNAAIAAIRQAGFNAPILVCGNAWSGAHSWQSSGNAAAMLEIEDPSDALLFDAHQYLDADSSGRSGECAKGAAGRIAPFVSWARRHRRRGFLGEFAAGPSQTCADELETMVRAVEDASDVFAGWTMWGGGRWWPKDYPFRLAPSDFTEPGDRPPLRALRRLLKAGTAA